MPPASRNHSLVANTNMCREGISSRFSPLIASTSHFWNSTGSSVPKRPALPAHWSGTGWLPYTRGKSSFQQPIHSRWVPLHGVSDSTRNISGGVGGPAIGDKHWQVTSLVNVAQASDFHSHLSSGHLLGARLVGRFFSGFFASRDTPWVPTLGPLHTRATSHDHGIVRAQKKVVQRPSQHTSKVM